MKGSSVSFALIPDSNQLWVREDGPPRLSAGFLNEVEACRKLYPTTVFVPEMVVQELVFQRRRALQKHLDHLERTSSAIETITGTRPEEIDGDELQKRVEAALRRQLKQVRFRIIPTPLSRIPWKELIQRSVNRMPPFEEAKTDRSEKGFRDAVIHFTVMDFLKRNPKGRSVCFVAGDSLIRETAKKDAPSLLVLETVSEFQGHLMLLSSKLEAKHAKALQEDANRAFYSPEDRSGFYTTGEIRSKLLHKYHRQFTEVDPDCTGHFLVGNERITKQSTSFTGKAESGEYEWRTELEYVVEFAAHNGHRASKQIRVSVIWSAEFADGLFSNFSYRSGVIESESVERTPAPTSANDSIFASDRKYGDRLGFFSQMDRILAANAGPDEQRRINESIEAAINVGRPLELVRQMNAANAVIAEMQKVAKQVSLSDEIARLNEQMKVFQKAAQIPASLSAALSEATRTQEMLRAILPQNLAPLKAPDQTPSKETETPDSPKTSED